MSDMASFAPAATKSDKARSSAAGSTSGRLARPATQILLAVGDIAAFAVACLILLPFRPSDLGSMDFARVAVLVATAVIVLHASAGLYPGYRLHAYEQYRRRALASFKVAALAILGTILLSGEWRVAALVAAFLAIGLVFEPLTRRIATGACRRLGLWGERAVIIAQPDRSGALVDYFQRHWQYGLKPELFSPSTFDQAGGTQPCIAVIADDKALPFAELAAARRQFSEVVLLADTPYFKVAGLRPADIDGQVAIRLAAAERRPGPDIFRRVIDLAVAVPAALLLAPLMLAAAVAVYLVDPGPVLYRQPREGLAGKTVRVLKLRTMYRDAEQRLEALLAADPAARAEWSAHFKLKRDPRILPVIGGLLRSTSFDELPQLFNIIAGDMGIVGPRPFPEYHLLAMNAEFRHRRRLVTPGLTGLWQISERSNADLELQRRLDEFYIDNRSLWFDWHILLSTIPAIFRRSGAY